MSFLSMVEANLPPGFRFHPRDDELICDYLVPKVDGADAAAGRGGSSSSSFIFYSHPLMMDVDLNKCEPWELPEAARVGNKLEWYFFSLHDRKYATGPRTNRATTSGYWKATGKDRHVSRKGTLVGMRKTLVFYRGRAPRGTKTEWVMHEFRWEGRTRARKPNPQSPPSKEDWVLCKVFCKSRGISGSRPSSWETSHDDMTAVSPQSHSPLMEDDSTYIDFEQHPTTLERLEQVSCFSSNTSHDPTLGPHDLQPPVAARSLTSLITNNSPLHAQFGNLPELSSDFNHLPPQSKLLHNVIMNQHLSRLEGHDNNGEAPNADTAAAHSCLPSLWSGFIS